MINKESILQTNVQMQDTYINCAKLSVNFNQTYLLCYFVLQVFLFNSCTNPQNEKSTFEKYYFPIKALNDPKTYIYSSEGEDSLDFQTWVLQKKTDDGQQVLNGSIRLSDGTITHKWSEERTSTGMVMKNYSMSLTDRNNQLKQIPAKVIYDDVFPFESDKGGLFLFNIKWNDAADTSVRYELIRNRIYAGDTILNVMDKKLKAIHFKIKERIEVNSEGILGIDLIGDEYYAEGVGLARFTKLIDGKRRIIYQLTAIR